MSTSRRMQLTIHGRVQGVFYRANARSTAARLQLKGWVANRPDGTVEALVEGPSEAVEDFVVWCHRGSPAARVDRVEIRDVASTEPLSSGFHVEF